MDYTTYLVHHGILGMKWGVRRYQNPDGTLTAAGKKRYSRKPNDIKKAVKEYQKLNNKATAAMDKADEAWANAEALYKKLGKTPISRIIEASKGTSDLAKEYLSVYEKASVMNDKADDLWRAALEAYERTGRNRISRVINNAKYDDEVWGLFKEFLKNPSLGEPMESWDEDLKKKRREANI